MKNENLVFPTGDEILKDLGYNLDLDHPNEIVYKKQMLDNSYVYIQLWKSQDDTYILKYSSENNERYKFSLDEFEAVQLLLIEKGWI